MNKRTIFIIDNDIKYIEKIKTKIKKSIDIFKILCYNLYITTILMVKKQKEIRQ